ncbi:MAG: hypothetical protein HOJ35_10145, partial [Bdellovibrionales bacterium]|nr:hypothetical protein [Bdellovibrionales bacterium]
MEFFDNHAMANSPALNVASAEAAKAAPGAAVRVISPEAAAIAKGNNQNRINVTTSITNQMSGAVMPDSCNYNMDSQYDRDNCNDCFNNENCRVTDCNSVCNLEYCENGEDTCEAHAIVDLYKTVFNKYKAHHNSIENPEIQKMDMDFSSITGTGENGVSRNLWNMLTSMYDIGTLDSKSNYVDLQRLGNLLKSQ